MLEHETVIIDRTPSRGARRIIGKQLPLRPVQAHEGVIFYLYRT